jgi:murein tripeptide amidase MpaA
VLTQLHGNCADTAACDAVPLPWMTWGWRGTASMSVRCTEHLTARCRRGSDAKAAAMLDGMVLALMLSMNPDGFAAKRRGNG